MTFTVNSPDGQIEAGTTVTYTYDGTGSCLPGEFPPVDGFQLTGLSAAANVQLSIRNVYLFKPNTDMTNFSYPAGSGYQASVRFGLTGNDAGSYYLSTKVLTVGAAVAKRSLNGENGLPNTSNILDGVNNTYAYSNGQEVKPQIKEIRISPKVTVTGTAAGEAALRVQYSVPGAQGEGTKVYQITYQITVSKKDDTGGTTTPSTSGGVTTVSVKPSVSGSTATAEVSSSTSKSLVEQAVKNNSSNVTVRVEAPSGSTAVNSVTARPWAF